MNKIVIPTILVATVLIAGIFAFAPVDKASSVHEEIIAAILAGQGDTVVLLSGAHLERIQTPIDNDSDGDGTTWTQIITYDRTSGTGAFQIEKLYICGLDETDNTSIDVGFDVETDALGDDFISSGQPSLVSSDRNPIETGFESSFDGDNKCVDLRTIAHNLDSPLDNEVGHTFLGGDELNNVNVRIFHDTCSDTFDQAFIIAYISGLTSASDIGSGSQPFIAKNLDSCGD